MKDVYKSSMLYDFYGELLTEHQKEIYEDFILNDYSLGEMPRKGEFQGREFTTW